ncbi:uncharacterized protein LOC129755920 [Uranotaenia lowii]|uniref:uncharacterized protein LOC129755920 n=1 Tax=Uranotaenia lowii TaxID=190385 RepID=UPI00247A3C4C|nr:uncharacterized protein LOC129755920 [Uranotaenia lowii]
MLSLKLAALVLLSTTVLAAKSPSQSKTGSTKSPGHLKPTTTKTPHGKREATAGGYGHMDYVAPTHPGYSYGVPQQPFNYPQYHKYFSSPYKFQMPQASFFAPAAQHGYNMFSDAPVKYNIGSKELADLLKALSAQNPSISIKAVPSGHGWDSPFSYDTFDSHYKPTMIKFHEIPSYGTPLSAPAYLSGGLHEPTYAAGVKGLRHFASTLGTPVSDLYSGNKYISAIKTIPIQHPSQIVSPLHTSITHNPKPFKPSTYLGSTNEISEYAPTQIPTSSIAHNSYLAPALQYLPPSKVPNKHEQPSKHYLPVAGQKPNTNAYLPPPTNNAYLPPTNNVHHQSPNNAYLPPVNNAYLPPTNNAYLPPTNNAYLPPSKPSNKYLPAAPSSNAYLPPSHDDKHLQHLQNNHHSVEESNESYGFSATGSAPVGTTAKPYHHPWQP